MPVRPIILAEMDLKQEAEPECGITRQGDQVMVETRSARRIRGEVIDRGGQGRLQTANNANRQLIFFAAEIGRTRLRLSRKSADAPENQRN
jgi:hypothetical protein